MKASLENDIFWLDPADVTALVDPIPQPIVIYDPDFKMETTDQPPAVPSPIIIELQPAATLVPVANKEAEKTVLPFFLLDSDEKQVKTVEPDEPVAVGIAAEPTETNQNIVPTLSPQKKSTSKKGGNQRSGRKDRRKQQQAAELATFDPALFKPKIVEPPVAVTEPKKTEKAEKEAVKPKKTSRLANVAIAAALIAPKRAHKPTVKSAAPATPKKSIGERVINRANKSYEQINRHKKIAAVVGAAAVAASVYLAFKYGANLFNDATETANNTELTGQGALGQEAAPTKAPTAPPEVPAEAAKPPVKPPTAPVAPAVPELGDLVTVSKGDGMTDLIKQLAQDQGLEISGSKSFSMYEQVQDQLKGADGTYQMPNGEVRIRQSGGQFRFPIEAQRMLDELLEAEKKRKGLA